MKFFFSFQLVFELIDLMFVYMTLFKPISGQIWFDKNHFVGFGLTFDEIFLESQAI